MPVTPTEESGASSVGTVEANKHSAEVSASPFAPLGISMINISCVERVGAMRDGGGSPPVGSLRCLRLLERPDLVDVPFDTADPLFRFGGGIVSS
jgi:hypothetical protein